MKSRIDPFSLDYPLERRRFDGQIFHMLGPFDRVWLEKHGHPNGGKRDTPEDLRRTTEGLMYLSGEVLAKLYVLTNGNPDLVTPEMVEQVYDEIKPDPDFYPDLNR